MQIGGVNKYIYKLREAMTNIMLFHVYSEMVHVKRENIFLPLYYQSDSGLLDNLLHAIPCVIVRVDNILIGGKDDVH